MCGRARSSYSVAELRNICRMNSAIGSSAPAQLQFSHAPVENFSPGRQGPVVTQSSRDPDSRQLQSMTWGLIPHFSPKSQKLDHFFMFNCRVETITEKRSFRHLFENGKRCVVVHNGFYEWAMEAGEKMPYYIYDPQGEPLIFPALYDHFETEDGSILLTYTILTSPSCSKIKFLHHRQPIRLLSPEEVDIWLNPDCDKDNELLPLLNSWSDPNNYESLSSRYTYHPISPKMNALTYQFADCATAIKKAPAISSFFKTKPKASTVANIVTDSSSCSKTGSNSHSSGSTGTSTGTSPSPSPSPSTEKSLLPHHKVTGVGEAKCGTMDGCGDGDSTTRLSNYSIQDRITSSATSSSASASNGESKDNGEGRECIIIDIDDSSNEASQPMSLPATAPQPKDDVLEGSTIDDAITYRTTASTTSVSVSESASTPEFDDVPVFLTPTYSTIHETYSETNDNSIISLSQSSAASTYSCPLCHRDMTFNSSSFREMHVGVCQGGVATTAGVHPASLPGGDLFGLKSKKSKPSQTTKVVAARNKQTSSSMFSSSSGSSSSSSSSPSTGSAKEAEKKSEKEKEKEKKVKVSSPVKRPLSSNVITNYFKMSKVE